MDSILQRLDVDFAHRERLSVKNRVPPSNWRVEAMKYLLLCCHEEKKVDTMTKREYDAVMAETGDY